MGVKKIFNQYTGGEESLKYWDKTTFVLVNDQYFWTAEEFKNWMYEDEITMADLIKKANSWGIQYNPQNNMFYLPKGSVLKSEYFDTQKELNLEYWYNDQLIDNIDSTEDMEVEIDLIKTTVEITVKIVREITVDANSEDQAKSIAEMLYQEGLLDMSDGSEKEVEIEVL